MIEFSCDSTVYEIGIAGNTKGMGKNVNFGYPVDPHDNFALSIDFQLPLQTGNHWTIYVYDKGSVSVLNSGTYEVVNEGVRRGGAQRVSLASQVRQMLNERRLASNASGP
ncbi:MAG TPA: hypothetical protein VLC74_04615 [Rhizomicrobium sp.]|nr:hypothetical protein [Rhizomicrobium sp.]